MEQTCLNRRGEAGRRYVCFTIGVECYYRWGWGKKAMILLFGVVLLFLNSFKLASGEHKIPFAGTIFYSTPLLQSMLLQCNLSRNTNSIDMLRLNTH